jgi:hypothetical protein
MIFESDIERRLVTGVEKLGGICLKHGQDGWPDRIAILPNGGVVWVETKRPDGKVASIQKWRHATLRKLGQQVETPYTAADVDQLLDSWK